MHAALPNALVFRYAEIATKGKNRSTFERRLVRNLRRSLADLCTLRFHRERGRIYATPEQGEFPQACLTRIRDRVSRVFGLASMSPAFLAPPTLSAIEEIVDRTFGAAYAAAIAESPPDGQIAYAMRARRHQGAIPMTSTELEIRFAERLLPQYPRLVVDLKNPRLRVEVEVRQDRAFIAYERIPGPGGLPVGVNGATLTLLSGGIDSPVAAHMMMKRGLRQHFVTFHSAPYTPPDTVDKVVRLARRLNVWQGDAGRLFAVNLLHFQKAVRDHCAERFRTLLYRRMMMRVSTRIAARTKAAALVTGEAVGQVASQTVPNLTAIQNATPLVVLRPLVGMDKLEAVARARDIETYEISCEPVPDSCTVFAPSSPATRASAGRLQVEEARIPCGELLEDCMNQVEMVDLVDGSRRPWHERRKPFA